MYIDLNWLCYLKIEENIQTFNAIFNANESKFMGCIKGKYKLIDTEAKSWSWKDQIDGISAIKRDTMTT